MRLTMIALFDTASNLLIGYELAPSENAVSTARIIRKACERHGIFDMPYANNGSAFAGHLVAGGVEHKFRNAATNKGMRPLGICHHLGIQTTFALPENAQSKIAERMFKTLSRVLDDRPEFRLAHTGHNPGAIPNAAVTPVPLATVERVVAREVERDNRDPGRRSQGANGRSYQAVFDAGFADRVPRRMTNRQKPALSEGYIMADHLRLANTNGARRRDVGDFAMTETAQDIYRSLDLVRQTGGPADRQ